MRYWGSNAVHHPTVHHLQLPELVLPRLECQLSPRFGRHLALMVPAVVHKELLRVVQV